MNKIKQSISEGAIVGLSDKELLARCEQYGKQTRLWRQRFLGLLPEVAHRKLYEQKGFSSIAEFACIVGGVNEKQVKRVLQLENAFRDKPSLHQMLTEGEVSADKLRRVVSVATPNNEKDLAFQAKLLPRATLQTLVRDMKGENMKIEDMKGEKVKVKNSESKLENKTTNSSNFSFGAGPQWETKLKLSPSITCQLQALQEKGIDLDKLLEEFLHWHKGKIMQEKDALAQEIHEIETIITPSRHIPAKIINFLKKEFGTKCSVPKCKKEAVNIHHTGRFALTQSHNPYFLAPLCREHHIIAHSIDRKVNEKRINVMQHQNSSQQP